MQRKELELYRMTAEAANDGDEDSKAEIARDGAVIILDLINALENRGAYLPEELHRIRVHEAAHLVMAFQAGKYIHSMVVDPAHPYGPNVSSEWARDELNPNPPPVDSCGRRRADIRINLAGYLADREISGMGDDWQPDHWWSTPEPRHPVAHDWYLVHQAIARCIDGGLLPIADIDEFYRTAFDEAASTLREPRTRALIMEVAEYAAANPQVSYLSWDLLPLLDRSCTAEQVRDARAAHRRLDRLE